MTLDEFDELLIDQGKVRKNHLDDNASYGGYMFETFGAELEYVKAQPEEIVLTLVDCDDESEVIEGYHWVNRVGYFVLNSQGEK